MSEKKPWGGKRWGAGRKRKPGVKSSTRHRRRRFSSSSPAHIVLRAVDGLRSLRGPHAVSTITRTIKSVQSAVFRIVHYSIQSNHIHLIVESGGTKHMSKGMRQLVIRLALRINRTFRRDGQLWADRWFARQLNTQKAVRKALRYVLFNAYKHGVIKNGIDVCSSARWTPHVFGDVSLRSQLIESAKDCEPPISGGQTWLLSKGWRSFGLLTLDDGKSLAVEHAARSGGGRHP